MQKHARHDLPHAAAETKDSLGVNYNTWCEANLWFPKIKRHGRKLFHYNMELFVVGMNRCASKTVSVTKNRGLKFVGSYLSIDLIVVSIGCYPVSSVWYCGCLAFEMVKNWFLLSQLLLLLAFYGKGETVVELNYLCLAHFNPNAYIHCISV